jgi:hypothetical protein
MVKIRKETVREDCSKLPKMEKNKFCLEVVRRFRKLAL